MPSCPIDSSPPVQMHWLNLGFNDLRGPIPDALGSLLELSTLCLQGNRLDGKVPDAAGFLSSPWLSIGHSLSLRVGQG